MKKFYWKKSIPQKEEPILIRLERRHTVVEGNRPLRIKSTSGQGKDSVSEDETQFKTAYRSLSECRLSTNTSPASTVIITDSDLSNSWIYTRSKAAAAADNEAYEHSPTDDHSPVFSPEVKACSTLQHSESKLVPVPLAKHSDSCSSICCYLGVFLILCFCVLGILGVVGSIVYMELYATIEYSTANPESVADILSNDLSKAEEMDNSIEISEVFDPDPEEKSADMINSRRGKFLDGASNEIPSEDNVDEEVIANERSQSVSENSQDLKDVDVSESKLDVKSISGEEVQPSETDDKSVSSSSTQNNADLFKPLDEDTSIKTDSVGTSHAKAEDNLSINKKETMKEQVNTLSVNFSENFDIQLIQFKIEESTKREETSQEWSIIKDILMKNFSTNSFQESSTQVAPTILDEQENQQASEKDQFDHPFPNNNVDSNQDSLNLKISNESNIAENSQVPLTTPAPDDTPLNEFSFNHPIVRENVDSILPIELLKRLEIEEGKIRQSENQDMGSVSEVIKRLHIQEARTIPMSRAKSSHLRLNSADTEEERKNYKHKLRLMNL